MAKTHSDTAGARAPHQLQPKPPARPQASAVRASGATDSQWPREGGACQRLFTLAYRYYVSASVSPMEDGSAFLVCIVIIVAQQQQQQQQPQL